MKIIWSHRLFPVVCLCAIFQQVAVGASTLAIGSAASNLTSYEAVIRELQVFFLWIVAAYLLGIAAHAGGSVMASQTWLRYATDKLKVFAADYRYATPQNKKTALNWLTGEAHANFEKTSEFIVDALAAICNVIFTIVVFFKLLGVEVGLAVSSGLVLTALALTLSRKKSAQYAGSAQGTKIDAFSAVQSLWDKLYFARQSAQASYIASAANKAKTSAFWHLRSVVLAQVVATLPVFSAMLLLLFALQSQHASADGTDTAFLATLVALLPRSLQLLQSVHLVGSLGNQATALQSKLRQTLNLHEQLCPRPLERAVNWQHVTLTCLTSGNQLTGELLRRYVHNTKAIPVGRYRISGRNGAGKSTLLKILKADTPEAVLIGPGIEILSTSQLVNGGSTGQLVAKTIRQVIEEQAPILFLDEWDANLDSEATRQLDRDIAAYALNHTVIEVRHKHEAHPQAHVSNRGNH